MKKYLLKFGVLILALLVIAGAALTDVKTIFAEEQTQNIAPDQKTEECATGMEKYFEVERPKYLDFIQQHFQNQSVNSDLVDTAVSRYRQYKTNAMEKFAAYYPEEKNKQAEEVQKQSACYTVVKSEIESVRGALKTHVETTAKAKTQTALIQKYQSINSQLRKLNINLAELKGFIDSFENKLPKFIYKCL